MCGIVGIINRETAFKQKDKLKDWFNQALFADSLRGKHGTGVLGVNDKGEVDIYKRSLPATDFLELTNTKKVIDRINTVFLVGHNRWATRGSHTSENSHPFSHGSIHLVHNGGINYYQSLNKGAKSFDVDSDALTYFLANAEDVKTALEEVSGSYSLVWYDEITETLNFARNEERPMYIASIKDSKSLLFASEPGMLRWLAYRNGIEIDKVVATPVGVWLQVPLDEKEEHVETPFTPKVEIKGFRNFHYPTTTTYNSNKSHKKVHYLEGSIVRIKIDPVWVPYQQTYKSPKVYGCLTASFSNLAITIAAIEQDEAKDYLGKYVKAKITSVNDTNKAYAKIIELSSDIEVLVKGPNNSRISKKDFNERVKNGCSNCSCTIDVKDADEIGWDWNGNVYCKECDNLYSGSVAVY